MMAGGGYNTVDPEAQENMILTPAQKNTMDGYLKLDPADEALKLGQFPEWKEVLTTLQREIKEFYAANEGKEPGVDMPGFDSNTLHMWHIYVGGLRQLNDGTWVASDIDMARTLAENSLDASSGWRASELTPRPERRLRTPCLPFWGPCGQEPMRFPLTSR